MADMTIAELVQAAKDFKATPEYMDAMMLRLDTEDKESEENARKRAITSEWLNRQYTI